MTIEHTGGPVGYYTVHVQHPTSLSQPYDAECNDIIEALDMNFAEGEAFKAIWRKAASRALGKSKSGDTALYNAEKVEWMGHRLVEQERHKPIPPNPDFPTFLQGTKA